jgi:filamentous hemagglutinin
MTKEADLGKVKDVSKAGDTAKTADNAKPEGSAGEVTSPGDGVVVKPAGSAPNETRASVDDKLARYLLNKDHPVGGSKAKWFEDALGFNQNNADDLAKQIVFDEKLAVSTELTKHGQKYNQVISIQGANGRNIDVNFGWIRNNDGVVRLITGIPTKK